MIGLATPFMLMFLNVMFVAELLPGEFCHVLILIPFVVPEMVLSLTTSPLTSPSSRYLPKLPTLNHHRGRRRLCRQRYLCIRIALFHVGALPDSMPWTAGDAADSHMHVALPYRDAVISCSDHRVTYGDIRATFYVDSVGVGAIGRCMDPYITALESLASHYSYVEELAVQGLDSPDDSVIGGQKLNRLQSTKTTKFHQLVYAASE